MARSTTRCAVSIISAVGLILIAEDANAVPSFARQTGLQCSACHAGYPALNAFGREFKLNGYVFGGGDSHFPPLAAMIQGSFTHTEKDQPTDAAKHFRDNDNLALQQASIFYGGRIYDKLGAFVQSTYDGVADRFAIDNTDIRYANSATVANTNLVYGFSLNNNPTVQDLWNTTPAWGYRFASSRLAPTPTASTLIEGGLAQQVAGLTGYMRWNNLLYGEIGGYRTLSRLTQTRLGISPEGESQIDGTAPYWRANLQKDFGDHYLAFGTFGLAANTFPGRDMSAGVDRQTDLGIDLEYQYSVDPNDFSLWARFIHEDSHFGATQALGLSDNAYDVLRRSHLTASYLYDQTYGLDLSFFLTTGSTDATLYGTRSGRPTSESYIIQFDYLPFNKDGGPSVWEWFNPKFIIQYVAYRKFDGSRYDFDGNGRNASDNNTLYVAVWMPF